MRALQGLLHVLPDSPDLHYCLALTALLRGVGSSQAAHFRTARVACTAALHAVDVLIGMRRGDDCGSGSSSSSSAHAAGTGPLRSLLHYNLSQLHEARVRLMVAISECHQHSRLPGCQESAHQWASDALAAATAAAIA